MPNAILIAGALLRPLGLTIYLTSDFLDEERGGWVYRTKVGKDRWSIGRIAKRTA